MLLQLNPPMPLNTPKGHGMAVMVIDHGPEHHLVWVVIDDATGEIWSWENPKVRGTKNITWGRPNPQRLDPTFHGHHVTIGPPDAFTFDQAIGVFEEARGGQAVKQLFGAMTESQKQSLRNLAQAGLTEPARVARIQRWDRVVINKSHSDPELHGKAAQVVDVEDAEFIIDVEGMTGANGCALRLRVEAHELHRIEEPGDPCDVPAS